MQEKFCDTVYIDQRDNSTRLVYGDVNGSHIRKIVNSARNYFAKNLGNGEVIATEVTDVQRGDVHFIANGESIDEYDPRIHGDSFVRITVPISFKCVEIEEDLFELQWRADHKPDDTWKEVHTDEILFGTNFIFTYDGRGYGIDSSGTEYNTFAGFEKVVLARGAGYSMFKYALTSMFKSLSLCVNGKDYGEINFMRMSRIVSPTDNTSQEVLTGAYIYDNGNIATLYATDVEGVAYELKTEWVNRTSSGKVKKLNLSPNLDMIPREYGDSDLYKSGCWYGGTTSNKRYIYSNGGTGITGVDKNSLYSSSLEDDGSKEKRCRLMFQGKINYTQDIEYYLSLPNI